MAMSIACLSMQEYIWHFDIDKYSIHTEARFHIHTHTPFIQIFIQLVQRRPKRKAFFSVMGHGFTCIALFYLE